MVMKAIKSCNLLSSLQARETGKLVIQFSATPKAPKPGILMSTGKSKENSDSLSLFIPFRPSTDLMLPIENDSANL